MTSPSPSLGWVLVYVDDVATAVSHYVSAYGLAIRFEHESGDYAELETGPTTLALCSRDLASQSTGLDLTAASTSAPSTSITLVYDDVPSAFIHAVEHGARAIHEPVSKPWGQVSSYVADCDGNLVELASAVPG